MSPLIVAMSDLTAARVQMTLSLAFHIIFAAIGIGLPLLVVLAEHRHLKTGQPHYLRLTRKWSKAIALLFAIGAVSGTALSFELGLLWPGYMKILGGAVGHLFALEGFAFFIEAIFIGLYLYGWNRLSPRAHWWCGIVVAVSGMLSGVLVLGVNAWMQCPVGITIDAHGTVTSTDPYAIFSTRAWWTMAIHSTLACYLSVGFAVAAVYAVGYLKGRRDEYHRAGMRLGLVVGGVCTILQMLSGDAIARFVYATQPAKFAALEAHFETSTYAPIILGGIVNSDTGTVDYAIRIPAVLSFLATHDFSAEVKGLNDIPRELWPNVPLVHTSFDIMVGSGAFMALVALSFALLWWRRRDRAFDSRWLLRAIVLCGILGFVALEAGWVVTEAGRQPWVIHGILKTADAVTPAPNIARVLGVYTLLYLLLATTAIALLRRMADRSRPVSTTP